MRPVNCYLIKQQKQQQMTGMMKELIDHLGGAPVVMVGWSLAVDEALTYVEIFGTSQLHGLVLVDRNLYTVSSQEERDRRYTMLHGFQVDRKHFAHDFVRGMYHKPHSEEYLEAVTTASLKTPTNSAVALLAESAVKNHLLTLPKIKIPLLAVMTENNRAAMQLILSSVPGSQGEVFADAGHCLFVDDADRFLLHVRQLQAEAYFALFHTLRHPSGDNIAYRIGGWKSLDNLSVMLRFRRCIGFVAH